MKVYKLENLEDYRTFVRDISEKDQPVYIYVSELRTNLVLISPVEVNDPDLEIDNLLEVEKLDEIIDDDIIKDDDEILFDYSEDGELGLIL